MIASTPEATKLLIWSSCLATSFCASSTCTLDAVQCRLGLLDHAVAQHGQEVVVEQRHRHADLFGEGRRRHERRRWRRPTDISSFYFSSTKLASGGAILSGTSCRQESPPEGFAFHRIRSRRSVPAPVAPRRRASRALCRSMPNRTKMPFALLMEYSFHFRVGESSRNLLPRRPCPSPACSGLPTAVIRSARDLTSQAKLIGKRNERAGRAAQEWSSSGQGNAARARPLPCARTAIGGR